MCFAGQEHWDRFHIVHCGVDPDRHTVSSHRGRTLLFVGRLAAVKGLPVLLDALRGLEDGWHLTVIGDGPDRDALEAQAADLPVDFVGYKSQAVVAEALSRTDVFVLPSFAEGVPVVLTEAMASGVPVVTTQIAGIPELVEDGVSGHLVPPGDADTLREAIADLLQDADKRRAMGAEGRARVIEEFNITTEEQRLSDLFQHHAPEPPR